VHLIFCTKVAAYADAFGAEKAAEEYELTVKQVEEISLLVHGFRMRLQVSGAPETKSALTGF
jgi:hypothetical protein